MQSEVIEESGKRIYIQFGVTNNIGSQRAGEKDSTCIVTE